ncbi:MAG: oligosaccharide flippase family protein [Moorea sp. SIO3C2]|nr:oligosaccharide flippase family protein [Moorena sp. SIO3C2]
MSKTFSNSKGLQLQSLGQSTVIAIVIRVTGFLLTYLLQICLARWMGETQYGIYAYVFSLSFLLSILACLGLPHTVLRFVSEYSVTESWGLLRGIIRFSWVINLLLGIAIALVGTGLIFGLNSYHHFIYANPLTIGIWLVPLFALTLLQRETATALGDINLAYTPYYIFVPVLILVSAFVVFEEFGDLSGVRMIDINLLVILVVVLGQLWLIGERLNQSVEQAEPIYAYGDWLKVGVVLWLMNGFGIILQQTDVIMVGSLLGPQQAGVYEVATKTSLWVGFVLQTVTMVVAPEFARLYKQNDRLGLKQAISTASIWIFWPSLLIAVFLILFAPAILSLFGPEFASGNGTLLILVMGQLVNALCGSVAFLMIMTGHQNQALIVYGTAAGLNVVLNGIGILLFGMIGAALSTAITFALWNIWLSVLVVKYLEVSPIFFIPHPDLKSG